MGVGFGVGGSGSGGGRSGFKPSFSAEFGVLEIDMVPIDVGRKGDGVFAVGTRSNGDDAGVSCPM